MTYDDLALRAMGSTELNNGPELLRRLRNCLDDPFPNKELEPLVNTLRCYLTEEEAIKHIKKMFKKGYKLKDVCWYITGSSHYSGIYITNEDGRLLNGNIDELKQLREKYIEIIKSREND